MISAIANQGDLRFMVFGERFTVPVFLEFLDRLMQQQSGEKVFFRGSPRRAQDQQGESVAGKEP